MKRFLFCESQEGGMACEIDSETEAIEYCRAEVRRMQALGLDTTSDAELLAWLRVAEIGDMFEYRLGVWVRLKDD